MGSPCALFSVTRGVQYGLPEDSFQEEERCLLHILQHGNADAGFSDRPGTAFLAHCLNRRLAAADSRWYHSNR